VLVLYYNQKEKRKEMKKMITKKNIRTIDTQLREFAKKSKNISYESSYGRTTLTIKATEKNAELIAQIIDFLGDFDWGEVEDLHGAEFYKYDEIWYHSIDSHLSPYAEEMAKYEETPFYEVLLAF
jgi:broad specificity phosphatase PhoE